jgi:DNA recombination protein RmuC
MNLSEKLLLSLGSPPYDQLQPLLWASLGALVCFVVMAWIGSRRKKRYQNLLIRYTALQEKGVQEEQYQNEKIALLENAGSLMRHEFKNLAQEIFDEKTRILTRQNSEKIDVLLKPYQEQLSAFRQRLETIFLEETRDHSSLKQELLNLRELNQRINEEAVNLTRAISGDNKQQGTWGEIVLERLLEQSGLRNGHEYETQTGLRDGDNRLFKPDVVIHLPDEKDIVVDSKVSLTGWSRFVGAENDEQRSQAMAEHVRSLRTHLRSLSSKDYSSLKGLRSLDFVLMFIPIDGAFSAAVQSEEKLIDEMYSQKVIIVTPTTLLATLRMIEYFWQNEHQSRNAVEIAERASSLYDKLRGFLTDMEKLGLQLDNCKDTYDKAINKLSQGRGNLISQAAKFPELGIKVKEKINQNLVDRVN